MQIWRLRSEEPAGYFHKPQIFAMNCGLSELERERERARQTDPTERQKERDTDEEGERRVSKQGTAQ